MTAEPPPGFWREYVLARLRNESLPDVAARNWTEPPSTGEGAWQADLQGYRDLHVRLMDEVRLLTEQRLMTELGRRDLRFYHLVVGLLGHDSYHAGQIAYVRALQGLPPVE